MCEICSAHELIPQKFLARVIIFWLFAITNWVSNLLYRFSSWFIDIFNMNFKFCHWRIDIKTMTFLREKVREWNYRIYCELSNLLHREYAIKHCYLLYLSLVLISNKYLFYTFQRLTLHITLKQYGVVTYCRDNLQESVILKNYWIS